MAELGTKLQLNNLRFVIFSFFTILSQMHSCFMNKHPVVFVSKQMFIAWRINGIHFANTLITIPLQGAHFSPLRCGLQNRSIYTGAHVPRPVASLSCRFSCLSTEKERCINSPSNKWLFTYKNN